MHITIIEDEVVLGEKMMNKLSNQGYMVSIFTSYAQFMQAGDNKSHLYIIDIGLGDGSGFDIIDWLRKKQNSIAPIIITSGYGDTERIVYGLNIGADDYMVKPCAPDEFVARVNALARRNVMDVSRQETMQLFTHHDLVYIPYTQTITKGGNKISLTKKETLIFELFIRNPKTIISRETIVEHVWGAQDSGCISDIVLNTSLSRIRKKCGGGFNLKCLYNFGYILQ